jgi:hypothetical protein
MLNMVFNAGMTTSTNDAELIRRLGGPSKVAELIAIDKRGGAQRVQNWTVRGIPAAIKVKYPHLFMPELANATPTQAHAQQGA